MAERTSADLDLYGYTRQPTDVRQPTVLATFLDEMRAQNFAIIRKDERKIRRAWMSAWATGAITAPLPSEVQTPIVSAVAGEAIKEFNAGNAEKLGLTLLGSTTTGPQAGFYFTFNLDATEGIIYATTSNSSQFIHNGEPDEAHYAYWLSILERIYTLWHPVLAFTINDEGQFLTTREQALDHRPAYLYDVNFFGPEVVAALGRDRFTDLPAWRNEPLDDGGILLVPALYETPDPHDAYGIIATRLGLATQNFLNAPGSRGLLDAISEAANRGRTQRLRNQPPTP